MARKPLGFIWENAYIFYSIYFEEYTIDIFGDLIINQQKFSNIEDVKNIFDEKLLKLGHRIVDNEEDFNKYLILL